MTVRSHTNRALNVVVVGGGTPPSRKLRRLLAECRPTWFIAGPATLAFVGQSQPDALMVYDRRANADLTNRCRRLQTVSANLPAVVILDSIAAKAIPLLLDCGVDDVVASSVSLHELTARVRAIARRKAARPVDMAPPPRVEAEVEAEPCVSASSVDVAVAAGVEAAPRLALDNPPGFFTRTEFDLLTYFLERAGRVVPHAEIHERVFGRTAIDMSLVRVHVANLRRKLGPLRVAVRTVHGRGYVLDLPLAPVGVGHVGSASAVATPEGKAGDPKGGPAAREPRKDSSSPDPARALFWNAMQVR